MSLQYDHIIVDGRHTLYRVASTMASLGVDDFGDFLPTGAIFGFYKVCLSVMERYATPGAKLSICWEGGWGHRREAYPLYKQGRVRKKEDTERNAFLDTMADQEQVLRQLLSISGWEQAWCRGYEADDVMATLAYGATVPTAIYSGDHDMHQCVTDAVHCLSPNNQRKRKGGPDVITWDIPAVEERWGVPPINVPDVKSLEGDASDNIPGCPKVGKVWARKMLQNDPHVEEVLKAAKAGPLTGVWEGKEWTSERHSALLRDNEDIIILSKMLATVVKDVPVEFIPLRTDSKKMVEAFRVFQFSTLLRPTVINAIKSIANQESSHVS